MARAFQDDNLMTWEAFASTGESGYADRSHVVFHCLSDMSLRPLVVQRAGDKADVEREVLAMPEEELRTMLQDARKN